MKKKLLSAVLSAAMLATMLTGCGGDDSSQTQAPAADTKTENNAETKADDTKTDEAKADDTQADASAASGSGKVYYLNFKPEQAGDWEEWKLSYRLLLPVHMSQH